MNKLLSLIIYILKTYPNPEELSKPRLVKLIYLVDWKYTIDNGKQYTDIKWFFHHYGPYVDDVISVMKRNTDLFDIKSNYNEYSGGVSDRFKLKNKDIDININDDVRKIADLMINHTNKMGWNQFISFIYSTYPIKTNSKYSNLDLVKLSKKFIEIINKSH